MADGTKKPISAVEVGDKVAATDPQEDGAEPRGPPVTALIRHSGPHGMVKISLSDRTSISATSEHPVWDATTNAWTYAEDLPVGDRVLTATGATLTVAGPTLYTDDLTAYNFTVDQLHMHYAGDSEVLVHTAAMAMQTCITLRVQPLPETVGRME